MSLPWTTIRNLTAFWIFGLCNNYAYVIMLSAAEDIMDKQEHKVKNDSDDQVCMEKISEPHCSSVSTGAVLLADILPTLVIKLTFPFFMHRIPFGVRHTAVVLLQSASYFIVAYSTSVAMSLAGVALASAGAGLGEITYLALSSYYSKNAISAWSSGTGGAGIIGALAYAGLTEPKMANLSPKNACLAMLVVPVVFAFAYWILLVYPENAHHMSLLRPSTWVVPSPSDKVFPSAVAGPVSKPKTLSGKTVDDAWGDEETVEITSDSSSQEEFVPARQLTLKEKLVLILPLLQYMIPLGLVYVGEYLINQGLTELIYFDCTHGFHLTRSSQYRWYQVIYQAGVFVSRSSVNLFQLPKWVLFFLPVLQLGNAVFFTFDAVYFFVPHIGIIFALILFEGLLGGASYVNAFHRIHNEVQADVREFSLSIASTADSIGIVISGFTAIPLHNFVCSQQKYHIK